MPNMLARIFRDVTSMRGTSSNSSLPRLNEISTSLSGYLWSQGQISRKKALMSWYKRIPELTSMINKISRDATSRGHFEPINPKESGRNRVLAANRFSQEVNIRKIRESQFADALITGEGFGWLGKITREQIKAKLKERLEKEIFLETKSKDKIMDSILTEIKIDPELFADYEKIDEDVLKPRKYRYVASSSMEVLYDDFDITGYSQIVGVNQPTKFSPKDIVRFTLMQRDGRVSGFTPVESILVQLELLRQMWQNMLAIHKNGGSPDKIFVLENQNVNSPSYQRIKEQLEQYKLVENKHGNMLFTGKVSVESLQQLEEMQFKDSGLYITGLIAMQWGIPRSSIPYIIGGTNTKDDTGGNSERGYWEAVSHLQTLWAETENTQLWIPYFGVVWVPENSFVNLDVQRETAFQLKLNNVIAMDSILMKSGKQIALEKRLRLLGINESDLEEAQMMEMQGTLNQQLSKDEVNDSDDKKNVNKSKKDEQDNVISSRGMKPTGVGKEMSFNSYPYVY